MGNGCKHFRKEQDPILYQTIHPDKNESGPNNLGPEFQIQANDFIKKKSGSIYMDYKMGKSPLGKGAYGEVRKSIHKTTGLQRAIKMIKKSELSEGERERMILEVEILKKIDHPNIIRIYEFYEDEENFYIVNELCTGGELFDRITMETRLSEVEAAHIMKQIFSAVYYCHKNKIVHRDLKPENILYLNDSPDAPLKIIDFGTSKTFKPNEIMNQKFGTPYYIAPEVLKKHYDEKCDIWSCGVILYLMLSGKPPFVGENEKEIMERVKIGLYSLEGKEWESVSGQAQSLIQNLLEYNPEKRPTAEQALNDPWIKNLTENEEEINRKVAIDALLNLRKFRINNKMQHAVWIFVLQNVTSSKEQSALLEIFKSLDKDNDGILSKQDIINGYNKIFKMEDATKDADKIMERVDINHSGNIDYMEFLMATANKQKVLNKKNLEKAFKMIDKDGNGFITKEEMEKTFNWIDMTSEIWEKSLEGIDLNKDGKISMNEFKNMMIKYGESFK